MTACTIDEALDDRRLLGASLGDLSTWHAWRTVLKATFALPLSRSERRLFSSLAGGRKAPKERVGELWAIAGRRSGKSRIAAAVAVFLAAFIDHRSRLAPGEVGYVLVLSPSKAQARVVKDYCDGFLQASPDLASMVESTTADEIRLVDNIVIAVHPASHRTVRGRSLVAVVLDEVAYFRDEASASPDIEVYRAVIPALTTTNGLMVGISSPYRKVGLLHQKHRDHYGQPGDVLVIQAPTKALNPTVDKGVIARAMAADPEAARSEWEAEFRTDLSSLLDDAVIDAAVDHDRPLELPHRPRHRYGAFVDMSAGRQDAATICIAHPEGEQIIVDVLRGVHPPFDPGSVAREFAGLAGSYGCVSVVGDNYAPGFVEACFRAVGLRYEASELPKSQLYLEAVGPFLRNAVSIPNDPTLIRELRLLERRVAPSGKDRVDHPQGGHDDYANAVCGALFVAAKPARTARLLKVAFGAR
jgi:hypothetical protein